MESKYLRQSGLIVAVILVIAAAAHSQVAVPTRQTLPPELEDQFRAADLDHDGAVSKEEARRGRLQLSDQFDSVDADHNGIVTLLELARGLRSSVGRWMSDWDAADTNHDGELSKGELLAAPPSIRNMFKTGGRADQRITREEYELRAHRTLYDNTDLPYVVPNIFEKRF
jgi:Ca2+-binding EF-hand superfamily protein